MEINLAAQKFTISYEHLDYDFEILLNNWLTILGYQATEEERRIFVQFEGECERMNCTTIQQIKDEQILTGSDLSWFGRLRDLPHEIKGSETKRKPKLESILAATLLRRILINCCESLSSITLPKDAETPLTDLFADMKISTRKGCIADSREILAYSVVVCTALKQLDLFLVSKKKIMLMFLLGLLEPQCKKYDGTAGKPSKPTKRREILLTDILTYEKNKRASKRPRVDNTTVAAEQVVVEAHVAMEGRKRRRLGGKSNATPSEANKKKARKNVTVATTPPSVEEARPCSVPVGREETQPAAEEEATTENREASQQEEEEAESSFWNAEGVGMTTSEVDEFYCKLRKLNGYYDETLLLSEEEEVKLLNDAK